MQQMRHTSAVFHHYAHMRDVKIVFLSDKSHDIARAQCRLHIVFLQVHSSYAWKTMVAIARLHFLDTRVRGRIGQGRIRLPVAAHEIDAAHHMAAMRQAVGHVHKIAAVNIVKRPVAYIVQTRKTLTVATALMAATAFAALPPSLRFGNESSDTTRINAILIDAVARGFASPQERTAHIARGFIGVPYQAHTLEGENEMLTVRLDSPF